MTAHTTQTEETSTHMQPEPQGLLIVGAGPAGLAPLFAAASAGRLGEVLELGVTVLERGTQVGAGALGTYDIESDSAAEALMDIVTRSQEPALRVLREHPVSRAVAKHGKGAVSLRAVGAFLALAGNVICELVASSARGKVLMRTEALWVQQTGSGTWRTRFRDAASREHEVDSTSVLLATGADQPRTRLWQEPVLGSPLLPIYADKLVQSGEVFVSKGLERIKDRLQGKADPQVAIVGGSTSAAAIADVLLQRLPEITFKPRSVALLHRSPLRIFYESEEQATRDGYLEFTPGDICALTGRVFRFSGFRANSRELIMRGRGIGHRPAEERLHLLHLRPQTHQEARACLDRADLVIAAIGYRPRLLPVLNRNKQEVILQSHEQRWSVVDTELRVLTSDGSPLQGLFAMGLAVGPMAHARIGGELGFKGQINSLWMWQHTLGDVFIRQVLARGHKAGAAFTCPGTAFCPPHTESLAKDAEGALAGAA